MTTHFEKSFSFDERQKESRKIKEKYPDMLPVIVSKIRPDKRDELSQCKFLVPKGLHFFRLSRVIKRKLEMKQEEALFLYINNQMNSSNILMIDVYLQHKKDDGFLYVMYGTESTFG